MPDPLDPVIMDLGDFVPEDVQVRFAIAGRRYLVRFPEATVDEVLSMIASQQDPGTPEGRIARHRQIVTNFLQKHLAEGDKNELAEDLKTVPYDGLRNLTIAGLFDLIQLRVKKNSPGETMNQ
jgi:hypothetical protein